MLIITFVNNIKLEADGKQDKGVGPYAEHWKPIPTQRYWAPTYFYTPPEDPQGVYGRDDCVMCHKVINPLLVKTWETSSHADFSNLLPYQQEFLKDINGNIGKEITEVSCIDCHGGVGVEQIEHSKDLIMPSSELCGKCHKKEFDEFESEKKLGIPGWPEGRESHAKAYDAALDTDIWAAMDKNIVQGCDMCHNIQHKCDSCHTRHAFKASEARRPEACATCHNGPDHPDIEDYTNSKHGTIYKIEGNQWDWKKPLKDYSAPAPTCAFCHMQYKGKFSHNMVQKAIMGEGDVLFYNNLFTDPPLKPSEYINRNKVLLSRREAWIETCRLCHSRIFAKDYLTSMDLASDAVFVYIQESFGLLKSLYSEKALYPMPENRPHAPTPVGEKWPDTLGGFYGEFWAKDGNPSRIEKDFLYMWENDAFLIRKGMAHTNPNAFTYISWSSMIKKYIDMQSEAATLRRLNTLENNMSLIQSLRLQKKDVSTEPQKHVCEACKKGQSGETIWCESCNTGYINGGQEKCKSCFDGKIGKKVWCDSCNVGYTNKSRITCKGCFDKGTICEACQKSKEK